jgi:transcriptional regulator of aromatic amino acid metabolism
MSPISSHRRPDDELLAGTTALRSLPDGIVICDRAGLVRFINPAAAQLLAINIDYFLGRSLTDLPGGDELNRLESNDISKIMVNYGFVHFRVAPIWSVDRPHDQIGKMIVFNERLRKIEDMQ